MLKVACFLKYPEDDRPICTNVRQYKDTLDHKFNKEMAKKKKKKSGGVDSICKLRSAPKKKSDIKFL